MLALSGESRCRPATFSKLRHSIQRLFGQRISWLRPAPISSAIPLHCSCVGRRRPSCGRKSAAGLKKDSVAEPCREYCSPAAEKPTNKKFNYKPCDKHTSMARKSRGVSCTISAASNIFAEGRATFELGGIHFNIFSNSA